MLWRLLAGSSWCTHVSSPVTIHYRKASPSWYHCNNCMHISTCAHLYSSVSCFGTHLPPEVLMDDGICRSTAVVQLVGCISDNNPSVLLNQSIYSLNTVCRSWSGRMARAVSINDACSATLEPFHPLVHLLHNTLHFVLTFFCDSWRVLSPLNTKIKWQHIAQQWRNPKPESTCWHYDWTSFTEPNSYSTTCLDLAQHVVCMMSTRMLCDKIWGFYANCPYFSNSLRIWWKVQIMMLLITQFSPTV
jgi:hypothetical protein